MMKIKVGSFGLGIASGLIVLVLFSGVNHLIHPVSAQSAYTRGGFGQNGTPNLARLSQRLGISQDQLQQELNSGKTIQQIMQENGVTPQFGGQRNGSGAFVRSGSGSLHTGSGTHISNSSAASQ